MTTQSIARARAESKFARLRTNAQDTVLETDDRADAILARDAKIVRLRELRLERDAAQLVLAPAPQKKIRGGGLVGQ